MIQGFEQQTHDLTADERSLLSGFIKGLKLKIGEDKAITNKAIKQAYKDQGIKISDARIRKIINHIRINRLVPNLIASSKGYYVATNQEEIDRYVESLNERASAILAVAQSFRIYEGKS